jgi:hypothetical protein
VNLCRADLSILKVIGLLSRCSALQSRALLEVEMQSRGQIQIIENKRREATMDAGILANAGFLGVE